MEFIYLFILSVFFGFSVTKKVLCIRNAQKVPTNDSQMIHVQIIKSQQACYGRFFFCLFFFISFFKRSLLSKPK